MSSRPRLVRLKGSLLVAGLLCAQTLFAQPLPPLVAPPRPAPAPEPPLSPQQARLRVALERFEFGDYAAVVTELEALVEDGGRRLDPADRLEALRAYGIACVLTGRATVAEGAFLLLLEAAPRTTLDPDLIRPEAVAVFESVRARRNAGLLAAYRKGRGRRYAVLNLLPPAGQLQNRDFKKGYALLGVELALLALNITTGSLLYSWRGEHQDFPGHETDATVLRPVNWVSFGVLVSVVAYGIIDGFVVGHRRSVDERDVERQLMGPRPLSAAPRRPLALDLSGGALGLRF